MDIDENMDSDDIISNLPDEMTCADLSDLDAILASNSINSRDNWI